MDVDNHALGQDRVHGGFNGTSQIVSVHPCAGPGEFHAVLQTVTQLLERNRHQHALLRRMSEPFTGCFDPKSVVDLYRRVPTARLNEEWIVAKPCRQMQQLVQFSSTVHTPPAHHRSLPIAGIYYSPDPNPWKIKKRLFQ